MKTLYRAHHSKRVLTRAVADYTVVLPEREQAFMRVNTLLGPQQNDASKAGSSREVPILS